MGIVMELASNNNQLTITMVSGGRDIGMEKERRGEYITIFLYLYYHGCDYIGACL